MKTTIRDSQWDRQAAPLLARLNKALKPHFTVLPKKMKLQIIFTQRAGTNKNPPPCIGFSFLCYTINDIIPEGGYDEHCFTAFEDNRPDKKSPGTGQNELYSAALAYASFLYDTDCLKVCKSQLPYLII